MLIAGAVTVGAFGYVGYYGYEMNKALIAIGKDLQKAPRIHKGQTSTWAKVLGTSTPLSTSVKCGFDQKCSPWFNETLKLRVDPDNKNYVLMFLFLMSAFAWRKVPSSLVRKDPGQGKWAGLDDHRIHEAVVAKVTGKLKKLEARQDRTNPRSLYIGHFVPWTTDGFHWKQTHLGMLRKRDRNEHVMIVGASGSGKTRGIFRQNIVLDAVNGNTSIVYDLKWPQMDSGFADLALYWKKRGRPVYVFAPFNETSMRLPLLSGIDTLDEALKLARAVIAPPEYKDETGAHYKDNERRALAAMILAIAQSPTPTMKELQRLGQMNASEIESWYKRQQNIEIKQALKAMFDKRVDQISDTLAGVMNKLQIFYNDNVSRATTGGNNPDEIIDLEKIFREGGLLIIGIESKYLQSGEGEILLQLIKRRIDKALMDVADASPGGALPVPATYYLDELPGLGRLPNLDKQLAQWRSKNVSMMLGVQNTEQGAMVYGEQYWLSMTTGNIGTRLFFIRGTTQDDAKKLSDEIGEYTVDVETVSRSQHAMFGSPWSTEARKGTSQKVDKLPLLSPEEIKRYPRNIAVVFPKGQNPMLVVTPAIDSPDLVLATPDGKEFRVRNQLYHLWRDTMGKMTAADIEREGAALIDSMGVQYAPGMGPEPIKAAPEYWQDWLGMMLEEGALARIQENDNKVKIMIQRHSLPEQLQQQRDLDYFIGCGWLNPSANEKELTITQAGLDTAGRHLRSSLQDFVIRGPALYWARTHKDQVRGYPGGPTDHGEAIYTHETLTIPTSVAEELYGVVPDLPRREIDGKPYVEIPLSDPKAINDALSRVTGKGKRSKDSQDEAPHDDPATPARPAGDAVSVEDNLTRLLNQPAVPDAPAPAAPPPATQPASAAAAAAVSAEMPEAAPTTTEVATEEPAAPEAPSDPNDDFLSAVSG